MNKKLPTKDAEGNWRCPECGARLVRRKGKFGEFWGCSLFRDTGCTYVWDGKFPEKKDISDTPATKRDLGVIRGDIRKVLEEVKTLKRIFAKIFSDGVDEFFKEANNEKVEKGS